MQVIYNRLFDKLKKNNILHKTLIADLKLANNTMQSLRHNKSVTTETIGKICEYLQCQPNDIMEVVYDDTMADLRRKREIAELEKKLAELKAK